MNANSEDSTTKPTLDTILERINSLRHELRGDIEGVRGEVSELRTDFSTLQGEVGELRTDFTNARLEFQLFRGELEIRLDRIESMTNRTRCEFLEWRADFREFRDQLPKSAA